MNVGGIGGFDAYRRQAEINAVMAAKVPGDTKRQAVVKIQNSENYIDAAEAISAVQDEREGMSFKEILKSKM